MDKIDNVVRRVQKALADVHPGKSFSAWSAEHGSVTVTPQDIRAMLEDNEAATQRVLDACYKVRACFTAWGGPRCEIVVTVTKLDLLRLCRVTQ